jgi:hypothetical protein
MKKLKYIFYPVYLLTILMLIVLSVDIQESILFLQKVGLIRYFSDIPMLGRNLLIFLAAMMSIELLLQGWSSGTMRKLLKQ